MRIGFWRSKTRKASEITSEQFTLDRMPRGTDTHVLTAKGVGVNPAYEAPPTTAKFYSESDTMADVTFTSITSNAIGAGVRETLLNVAAGGGQFLCGRMCYALGSLKTGVLEITIDGAAKQSFTIPYEFQPSAGTHYYSILIPPILFDVSLLISMFNNSDTPYDWWANCWHK